MSDKITPGGALQALAKEAWSTVMLQGALLLALGITAVAFPQITVLAMIVMFAAYALVDGVILIWNGVRGTGLFGRPAAIALGGLSVLVGVLVLLMPDKTLTVFVVLLAFWALAAGLFRTVFALELARVPGSGWGWVLASGLITVAFGVVAIVSPPATALALSIVLGVWAIALGVVLVIEGFQIRSFARS